MSLKIAFHTACQQSASEMDVDQATLVAACKLDYCIFQKENNLPVSEFAVSRAFWHDIMVIAKYRQFTRLFSHLQKVVWAQDLSQLYWEKQLSKLETGQNY